METTTLQSAAVPKPQPTTPSRPMPQVSREHPASTAMTVAELEAAIAALPGKRDALREAFDRLAACSPSPLPFAWEDLDGHFSSLQSSIALRFRQLHVLEAAGAAPAAAALGGNRADGKGENQEELEEEEELVEVEMEEAVAVEVEVEEEEKADEQIQDADSDKICNDEKDGEEAIEVAGLEKADEEMHEPNSNKICNDEKDGKETREVEVEVVVAELEKKADEEMQEADYNKICNDEKDRKEAREEAVEEEEAKEAVNVKIANEIKDEKEAREEEQTSKVNDQYPDKETQVVDNDKEELNTTEAFKASQDKKEDQDTDMDETAAKMVSSVQHKGEESCDMKQEKEAQQQDVHEKVVVAKNAMYQEAVIANEVSADQGNRALRRRSDDCNVTCANMDAQRLLELICTNTELNSEFRVALRRAPDAAALALHVVELFLHNKIFVKTRKVWESCVGLVQIVPAVVTNPSADTIEQAKQVAKDWKEMIDNPKSCNGLGSLASWGLLNFLISYNIVTEFDTKEIFCLFGNVPCREQKKSAMLLKGLGLGNRIPELMDYLIRNGQQMDVFWLARILNMVDKYPPLPLLKGYIEKAKQTAVGIPQKNMTHKFQIIKELDNLRRAHVLVNKKGIINSYLRTSIREEINILIGELEKQKRNLENPLTTSTSNSQQKQTKNKKKLKIEQKQEHQLSELAEKLEMEQRKPQQEQQQKEEDKPEDKKQRQEDEPVEKKQKQEDKPEEKKRKLEDKPEEKQQQNKQKHQKRLRQRTHQPPTQGYPAMWNAALRGDLERPPYAAMYGVHHGYPAQPVWRGVLSASPFMPQLGAPEYVGPFTPLCPQPQFYPR